MKFLIAVAAVAMALSGPAFANESDQKNSKGVKNTTEVESPTSGETNDVAEPNYDRPSQEQNRENNGNKPYPRASFN